jgi:hypothetical protein
MRKRETKPSLEDLESLEAHLAGTLRPVTPSKEFVHRLRTHAHLPERRVIIDRLQDWNRLFLVFGSVMSGMLAVITVARALYYLVWRRNMG